MAYSTVRVRVYDSRIQSLFVPGGDVWGYAREVGRDARALAVVLAPKRTLRLASSIDFSTTPVPMGVITTLRATAPHAAYVILGTHGPIRPTSSKYLRLTPGMGYPPLYRKSVRGQRANDFLSEAARISALQNGAL